VTANRSRPRPLGEVPFRALGGQPGFRPEDIEHFVDDRRIGVLAYVRNDGRPNQAPIWYTHRDGALLMTTTAGSVKERALARRPAVTLTIQDEKPPYRAVIADGTVTLAPLPDPDPTAGMSVRYFGRVGAAAYDRLTAETYAVTGMTLITLVPDELRGFDNRHALRRGERAFVAAREHLPLPRRWL
jgi:PPOX class probable F420-dependent enzyme